jgi:hypothetical protein
LGEDTPFPAALNARTFFSTLSHRVMSGNFPVNKGVGKRRNVRFSINSGVVLAGDVESIGIGP